MQYGTPAKKSTCLQCANDGQVGSCLDNFYQLLHLQFPIIFLRLFMEMHGDARFFASVVKLLQNIELFRASYYVKFLFCECKQRVYNDLDGSSIRQKYILLVIYVYRDHIIRDFMYRDDFQLPYL